MKVISVRLFRCLALYEDLDDLFKAATIQMSYDVADRKLTWADNCIFHMATDGTSKKNRKT